MTLLFSVVLLSLFALFAVLAARPPRARPVPVRIPSEQAKLVPPSQR